MIEVRDAVRQIRRSKGMLIVEGDEDARSAGSFFKNPVLTEEQFRELVGAGAGARSYDSELSISGCAAQSFGGLAGRAFGILEGISARSSRHLLETRSGVD